MFVHYLNMLSTLCMAPAANGEGTAASTGLFGGNGIWMIVFIVGLFVLMYFTSIRPQKKRQQEEQKLRDSIQIGDEITTIGGITGKVVTVKEDSIFSETGADKTRMKLMRWAIQTNNTATDRMNAEKEALAEAKAQEKEEKKASKRRSKKDQIDETK